MDPGALQVRPLCAPRLAAPLRPPPVRLGLTGGCHLALSPPWGTELPALQGGDARDIHHPVWLSPYPRCSPLPGSSQPPLAPSSHLPASLWGGCARGSGGTAASPGPQPHTFLKKHKKSFIKKNGSPGASPPASGTWVCIAMGAARALLPAPAVGARAGGGPGGNGGSSSGPAGATPLWSRGVSTGGSRGAAPSLAALGFLAGCRQVQVALVAADAWRDRGVGGGRVGGKGGDTCVGPAGGTHARCHRSCGRCCAPARPARCSQRSVPPRGRRNPARSPLPRRTRPPECPLTQPDTGVHIPPPSQGPTSE